MTGVLLAELRVLDLCDGEADAVTRLLADLGADVLKVEPPGGNADRSQLPRVAATGLPFALNNANKRGCVLDPADARDRDRFVELAAAADIVVDSGIPGRAAAFGASCGDLSQRFPHLVAMSVTDFGADGPRASWAATDPVFYALSTALSRSGPTAGRPVLPPNGIASATAAVQAAWAALVAYFHRLRHGTGEYVDFARFDAVVQSLDPPFGSEGQAAVGQKQSSELWRGRPRNQQIYPIFACRDGQVRICLLSPRQWRGMWSWLGEPAQFADPNFDTIAARYRASREINALIAELFAAHTAGRIGDGGTDPRRADRRGTQPGGDAELRTLPFGGGTFHRHDRGRRGRDGADRPVRRRRTPLRLCETRPVDRCRRTRLADKTIRILTALRPARRRPAVRRLTDPRSGRDRGRR